MDSLSSLNSIAELIRRRAAANSSDKLNKGYNEKLVIAKKKHEITNLQTAEAIKLKIINAVKAIDIQDPKKSQKTLGIFVENVLLWQFGEELMNDANFKNLVDEVSDALLEQPSIINQLNKFIAS